jgi:hypothetical protein
VEGDEPGVGLGQRQDEEEEAERVERAVLAGRQERLAGQDVRVPERKLAGREALRGEPLPGVVLEDGVADQRIVRQPDAVVGRVGPPRRIEEQVVDREQRPPGQEGRPHKGDGEDREEQRDRRAAGQTT